MKRILTAVMLLMLIVSPSFGLTDPEYKKMMKNSSFAKADKKLTQVWNGLKKSMAPKYFEQLKKNQRIWIASGRDQEARAYIKKGYSRVEAYTQATLDRVEALPEIANDLRSSSSTKSTPKRKTEPEPKKTPPKREVEVYDDEDEEEEDDGDYGEIEEDRFKDSTGPEGNYSRQNSDDQGGFMTVLIVDKNEMEADITISILNPEATWNATGWIDDNVMEASDAKYSDCQAKFTFSEGKVVIETSDSDDWDEVLGSSNRLDGVYLKSK